MPSAPRARPWGPQSTYLSVTYSDHNPQRDMAIITLTKVSRLLVLARPSSFLEAVSIIQQINQPNLAARRTVPCDLFHTSAPVTLWAGTVEEDNCTVNDTPAWPAETKQYFHCLQPPLSSLTRSRFMQLQEQSQSSHRIFDTKLE